MIKLAIHKRLLSFYAALLWFYDTNAYVTPDAFFFFLICHWPHKLHKYGLLQKSDKNFSHDIICCFLLWIKIKTNKQTKTLIYSLSLQIEIPCWKPAVCRVQRIRKKSRCLREEEQYLMYKVKSYILVCSDTV